MQTAFNVSIRIKDSRGCSTSQPDFIHVFFESGVHLPPPILSRLVHIQYVRSVQKLRLIRVQYYSGTRLFRIRKRSENRIRMFCVISDDVATVYPNIRRKFPNVTRLKELRHGGRSDVVALLS